MHYSAVNKGGPWTRGPLQKLVRKCDLGPFKNICLHMVRQTRTLKTLTSLNKESRPFSFATVAFGVFPLFLPLAITAFGGPESYCSLAIIAFGAFEFIVSKC